MRCTNGCPIRATDNFYCSYCARDDFGMAGRKLAVALRKAQALANGRWSDWGTRAEGVGEIIYDALIAYDAATEEDKDYWFSEKDGT